MSCKIQYIKPPSLCGAGLSACAPFVHFKIKSLLEKAASSSRSAFAEGMPATPEFLGSCSPLNLNLKMGAFVACATSFCYPCSCLASTERTLAAVIPVVACCGRRTPRKKGPLSTTIETKWDPSAAYRLGAIYGKAVNIGKVPPSNPTKVRSALNESRSKFQTRRSRTKTIETTMKRLHQQH